MSSLSASVPVPPWSAARVLESPSDPCLDGVPTPPRSLADDASLHRHTDDHTLTHTHGHDQFNPPEGSVRTKSFDISCEEDEPKPIMFQSQVADALSNDQNSNVILAQAHPPTVSVAGSATQPVLDKPRPMLIETFPVPIPAPQATMMLTTEPTTDKLSADQSKPRAGQPDATANESLDLDHQRLRNDDVRTQPSERLDASSSALSSTTELSNNLKTLFDWPVRTINKLLTVQAQGSDNQLTETHGKRKHDQPDNMTSMNVQIVQDSLESSCDHASVGDTPSSKSHDAHVTTKEDYEYLQLLRHRMRSMTMSTAFSGIDTPATAAALLASGICKELDLEPLPEVVNACAMKNLHAVEWFSKSCDELARHPHGPACIFTDISSFWLNGIKHRISGLVESRLVKTVLKPLVLQAETVTLQCHCIVHNRDCTVARL